MDNENVFSSTRSIEWRVIYDMSMLMVDKVDGQVTWLVAQILSLVNIVKSTLLSLPISNYDTT